MKHFFSLLGGLAIAIAPSTLQAQIDWAAGAPGGTSGGSIEVTAGSGIFLDTGIAADLVGGNRADADLDGLPDNSSDYTVSAWINSTEDDGGGNALGERWWFGTFNQGIHLGIRNGDEDANMNPGVISGLRHGHWAADNSGTSSVPSNAWVHVAFAFDADGGAGVGSVAIYRDGVLEDTLDTQAPDQSATNLIIGSRDGEGGPGWGGFIDDVAIFQTVLSDADVASLAAAGADPVGLGAAAYYDFEDDQTGNTAANAGTLGSVELTGIGDPLPAPEPTADWTTGAPGGTPGGAVLFDGDNDSFLDTGIAAGIITGTRGDADLDGLPDNALDYTVSAWIMSTADNGAGLAADDDWWFGTGSQGVHFGVQNGNTFEQGHWSADTSGVTLVPVNTWVHAAYVYDADGGAGGATGNISIYYNGVLDTSADVAAANRANTDLIIGSRSGGRQSWVGAVDDLAIFQSVLSATDVASLASPSADPVGLGAVAYYNFEDDQSGTTAANLVPVATSGLTDTDGLASPQAIGVIAPTSGVLKGDSEVDGDVDFADIPVFIDVLLSGVFQAESDCDCSGMVDFADIPVFIDILLSQ